MIDLGRKNKIALGQSIDFVGPERNFSFAPSQQNIRMMPLLFGNRTYAIDEVQCFLEVRKSISARDVMFVDGFPLRHMLQQLAQFLTFDRRNTGQKGDSGNRAASIGVETTD